MCSVQRQNDHQTGMPRLEGHIPTIPCGATICMANIRIQERGLSCMAVFDHILETESGMKMKLVP